MHKRDPLRKCDGKDVATLDLVANGNSLLSDAVFELRVGKNHVVDDCGPEPRMA